MARKTMRAWIAEALADKDKSGPLTALSLCHMLGSSRQEVHTTKIGNDAPSPDDLATMFQGKADTYAQDLDVVQTFVLVAFYGDSTDETAAFPFRVRPQADHHDGLSTEEPTEAGMRRFGMRITDAAFGQVFRHQESLNEYTIRLLASQAHQISMLQRENIEAFSITKELLTQRDSKTHEFRMQQLKEEKHNQLIGSALRMAPALVNTVAGRNVFPKPAEDTALIEAIAEGLDAEKLEMIPILFPAPIAGPLMSRFQRYQEEKAAREKAADTKQLSPYRGDPEDDAAGG